MHSLTFFLKHFTACHATYCSICTNYKDKADELIWIYVLMKTLNAVIKGKIEKVILLMMITLGTISLLFCHRCKGRKFHIASIERRYVLWINSFVKKAQWIIANVVWGGIYVPLHVKACKILLQLHFNLNTWWDIYVLVKQ